MEQTETDSHSHLFDGTDPDRREYVPVSWQARRMVADYAELAAMSESDIKRYCGRERRT